MTPAFRRVFNPVLLVVLSLGFCGGCAGPAGVAPTLETAPTATLPALKVAPGDAFVVISGGGTPLSNNYSQYLQARALNDAWRARYPREAVWTFFGAGNRPGAPAVLADVRRQYKLDGLIVESWLPGELAENRPATKAEILGALQREILPRVAQGGTLTLFVGDHGELSRGKVRESAITLWQMQRTGSGAKASWRSDPKEILTVSELRAALDAGLGRGRVVFCFTCCHSGGFHHLDVPRAAPANPAWFRGLQPVACADWSETPAPARIAGFTATTEDSLAAGCDPDPDPEKWRGYERLFPEALLGVDLMSGKKLAPALSDFAAAHTAATLLDRTIDKPFRTSEAWLERYATLIETVLAESPALTPAVRAQVERYHRIVNGEAPGVSDPAFLAQQQQTERFLAALAEQNPSVALVLLAGTRADLTPAPETTSGGSRRRAGAPTNIRKLWSETIRPAWKAALVAKKVADIPEAARAFELQLIALEEKTPTKIFLPGDREAVRNELFWRSGYAQVDAKNQARAAIVARWEAGRRAAILAWARASSDEKIRAAALTWGGPERPKTTPVARASNVPPELGAKKEALQRALFYRRVLGAWAFLIAVDERGALERLAAWRALETSPLPSS